MKSPVEVRWLRVREVEKPSAPARTAVSGQHRHGAVILRGGGIAARAALAHHVDAQCGVRQLCADVHIEGALRQPVHIVREAFPGPGQSGAQHRFGNILDAFHQLNQPLMIRRPAGREADAAIAHDGGGDAILRRRRNVVAPGDLAVIMGVKVDKARRYQFAAGIDLFLAFARDAADLDNAAIGDGDVRIIQFAAESVGDVAAANHEVRVAGHGVSSRAGFAEVSFAEASFVAASWVVSRCCQLPRVTLRNASALRRFPQACLAGCGR